MKCEHCGYEAPERAVICPECGEILPRPKKPAAEEQAKKEPSPAAEKFSMPFLSAPADLEKADGIAAGGTPAGGTGKEVPPHPKDRRRSCGVCADPAGGGVLRLFLGL